MDLACYAVMKENDKWIISASGAPLITCGDRWTALETVRCAVALLARDAVDNEADPSRGKQNASQRPAVRSRGKPSLARPRPTERHRTSQDRGPRSRRPRPP